MGDDTKIKNFGGNDNDEDVIIEKKWYHHLIIHPAKTSWLPYWHFIIHVCYFYGFFRDPYFVAYRIARNPDFDDDFNKNSEPDLTKEFTIDIILATNIIFSALTTYRKGNSP